MIPTLMHSYHSYRARSLAKRHGRVNSAKCLAWKAGNMKLVMCVQMMKEGENIDSYTDAQLSLLPNAFSF